MSDRYNFENFEDGYTGTSSEQPVESSYEWNSERSSHKTDGEYHYSYINGNNADASHNPNNYDSAYSSAQSDYSSYGADDYQSTDYSTQSNPYSDYSYQGANTYSENPYSYQQKVYSQPVPPTPSKPKKVKVKKEKKPASKGFVVGMLVVAILASTAVGFGSGYMMNQLSSQKSAFSTESKGSLNINKVEPNTLSASSTSGSASDVTKKAANSVVEIQTESITTGSFARQYVQQGAGSGVIISSDGYIVTNHHVIDGAQSVKVKLRDGETTYSAEIIGSDEQNDIALLKVEADDLEAATFGDSSTLAVGDYVVAIGNPLGELGGTVTDGIISALARQVTIEDNNMTLLQTNAQINPGNSGGGLFNANGELIGIVNAKTTATEVEGIGFAIPVNNVLDIIDDLKNYGYVTGKVTLGMQFVDITSDEYAYFYGVNKTGCYVSSVTRNTNAEKAGFRTGDLITKVNGTDVKTSADIDKIVDNCKVGDTVTFTVYRRGQTGDLNLTLQEYVPSNAFSDYSYN